MSLQECLALMDAADEALDRETYEQFRKEELDLPDDCEMSVTAGTVRKINRLFSALDKLRPAPPRFPETFCSQCGGSFGPDDSGFSHCEDHQRVKPALVCIDCDAPLLAGEAACCRACEEKHLTAGAAT